ncbi:MAG: GntR family transcriptional regulator, partial [Candidatus Dormibacteraeota bacterium]|nr:GntR family transcriptional regulator [Candidatus Dormibacteraeota bacterium]
MNAAAHPADGSTGRGGGPRELEAAALEILGGSDAPLGSRQIARELRGQAFHVSEATVSRLLRGLDRREWTR